MAAEQKKQRAKSEPARTVKLTVPTPEDLHSRLIAYAAMSRPRKRPCDVVLGWIRAGLREYHPPIPKPSAGDGRLSPTAEPTAETAAEPAA